MEPATSPPALKFGPYLVDLRAGELRKNGSRIRLQEKPLRVLALLAERHGQMVSREELKKRLWPDDTFVDFETGLNTAVSKLRDALSDNVEKPRYIETIPRRGYRFLPTVERCATAEIATDPPMAEVHTAPDASADSANTVKADAVRASIPAPSGHSISWRWAIAFPLAALLICLAAYYG